MRSTYNIKDAKDDLAMLNDFLVELGNQITRKQAPLGKLEELLEDPEFYRLMNNIKFFHAEGYKYLAEIYASKANYYEQKAN